MTTIILTIAGILLAAAAALMVLWYGGDAFDGGSVRAEAVTITEMLNQVVGAAQLRQAQTGMPVSPDQAGMRELVDGGYMASIPLPYHVSRIIPIDDSGGVIQASAWLIANLDDGADAKRICEAIETMTGGTFSDDVVEWPQKTRRIMGCYRNGYPDSHAYLIYRKM